MKIDVVSFSPSPDAVPEMHVQTNAYDAEYGRSGGAFVNASTRSGTNQVHGSVYWFLSNDNLNANTSSTTVTAPRSPRTAKHLRRVSGRPGVAAETL